MIGGTFRIVARQQNNRNFEVTVSRSAGYFAKEPRTSEFFVDTEAHFYRDVMSQPAVRRLRRHLPSFCDYDPECRVLVLRLIHRPEEISGAIVRGGQIGRQVATELGRIVAVIHDTRVGPDVLGRSDVPWVLSLPAPGYPILRDISAANLRLLGIVQNSRALCRCLERLRTEWAASSMVHGDLRFANCLLSRRGRRFQLKVVDWELTGFGDPAWDIGCVFATSLFRWLTSMSTPGQATVGRLIRSARVPLRRLQRGMNSFWFAYSLARRYSKADGREFLVRAAGFAAARLVQTAFEQMTHARSLTPHAVLALQLSENIVAKPYDALSALMGIQIDR